ncbi:MAG TPA: matrixin family metalloprotease, partial [Verrucomicrobiae bacterium]|nr:matrixin family metalloprotease [Verrucomicrobiae bacterium]
MKKLSSFLSLLVFTFSIYHARSSVLPMSAEELLRASDAAFRGKVVGLSSFKTPDGLIFTRASLRVDERFKGTFPAILQVTHRGGRVGNEGQFDGLSPQFKMNGEYLLFVTRGADGKLHSTQGFASAILLQPAPAGSGAEFASPGQDELNEIRALTASGPASGADFSDQAGEIGPLEITGMLGNISSRFLQCDRGDAIPFLIDSNSLPAQFTLAQVTNAIQQAFGAWAAVTSLKFRFEGFQSFGKGADTIFPNDGKIRLQLTDIYNRITTSGTLGIGGRNVLSNPLENVGWDLGGNVAGNEFGKTGVGYVVLESTNSAMQDISTFTEVLCHEIGHALNMAHSSEVKTSDPLLLDSIMYFQAHADGRGARLGAYDIPVIQQIYPSNTPPFSFDRVMDVTTAPSTPAVPGINQVSISGYDLQSASLTFQTANGTTDNGSFSVAGNTVEYTPAGYFLDSDRLDPSGNLFYDEINARFSDGTNASPYVSIRVVSLTGDSDNPSDGIPDYWMEFYFGHSDPRASDKSRATDDADGDGLDNLQEYIAGSNPTNAGSAQRITTFNPGVLQ